MHREKILNTARDLTCGDRAASYGEPYGNLSNIADLWNAYLYGKYGGQIIDPLNFKLTAEDVAWMNADIKKARSYASNKPDNYIDGAAYIAIAGECRAIEEEE